VPAGKEEIEMSLHDPSFNSGPPEDLSQEIVASLAKRPGETIRCSRVAAARYRVNWWVADDSSGYDNPRMKGGQLATTHRISRSQYLEVTREGGGLKVRIISSSDS
jgi:hypothetical protein